MEIELLHIHHGDKKKQIDTSLPEGRNEVEKLLKNLCAQKCAVFLERDKKTYRVVGYDPAKDELIVETGRGKRKKTGQMKTEGSLATCTVAAAAAKVAAVAPVAGGTYTPPLKGGVGENPSCKCGHAKFWHKNFGTGPCDQCACEGFKES